MTAPPALIIIDKHLQSYKIKRKASKQPVFPMDFRFFRLPLAAIYGVQEASSSNLDTRTSKTERVLALSVFFSLEREPPAVQVGKKEFYLCPENKPPDV